MPRFPINSVKGEAVIDGHHLPAVGLYASFNKDINDVDAYSPPARAIVTGTGHFIDKWLYLVSGQHLEIQFENQSGLYIDHVDDVAFDFWMLNQSGQPVNARIIDKYASPGGYYIGVSGNYLDVRLIKDSTPTVYTSTIPVYSGLHHCFVAFDRGNNKIYTFIDGVQDSVGTIATSGMINNQSDFIFGKSQNGLYLFSGLIGDFRFYNFCSGQLPYDLPRKASWTYKHPGEIHPVISGLANLRFKFAEDATSSYFIDSSRFNHSGLGFNASGERLNQVVFLQSGLSNLVPHRVSGYWNDHNNAISSEYDVLEPDGLFVTYPIVSGLQYSIARGGVSLKWKPSETATTVSGYRVLFNSDGLSCLYFDGSSDKFYGEVFNVSGQWILCSSFQSHDFDDEYLSIQFSWDTRTGTAIFVSGSYSGNLSRKYANYGNHPKYATVGSPQWHHNKVFQVVTGSGALTNESRLRVVGPKIVFTSGIVNDYWIEPFTGPYANSGLLYHIKDSRKESGYDELVLGENVNFNSDTYFNIIQQPRVGESKYTTSDRWYIVSGGNANYLTVPSGFLVECYVEPFLFPSGSSGVHSIYKAVTVSGTTCQHIYFNYDYSINASFVIDTLPRTLEGPVLDNNSFHHLAVYYDNNGTLKLYVNAQVVDTITF